MVNTVAESMGPVRGGEAQIRSTARRNDPVALCLFLAAYVLVLVVVFAPNDFFVERAANFSPANIGALQSASSMD